MRPGHLVGMLGRALRLPMAAPAPPALGGEGGRLAPCPPTPNCVSSQAAATSHRVDPIESRGAREATLAAAVAALQAERGARILVRKNDYIHAECETRLLRFVDDVEFLWDEAANVLHVRSASRVGRSDLGANRARVERLRRRITGA